jgi:23S rRNA (guanine745-N1)-methyltransferase
MSTCTAMTCPVCGAALQERERSLHCAAGHTYDRNRHGYVDLLPHGHGRSALSGDTRAMIAARQRFLDAGHYDPLAQAIADRATAWLRERVRREPAHRPAVLDAGCGDGCYGARLAAAAAAAGIGPCLYGLDISRWALRAAARRAVHDELFLNDVRHRICLADASVDCLLNIFAPRNAAEFARVLRPGGLLLVVIPDRAHLAELAAAIDLLGHAPDKPATTRALFAADFEEREAAHIRFDLALSAGALNDLLRMTPNAWHLEDAVVAAAAALAPLHVTASFELLLLRRAPARAP